MYVLGSTWRSRPSRPSGAIRFGAGAPDTVDTAFSSLRPCWKGNPAGPPGGRAGRGRLLQDLLDGRGHVAVQGLLVALRDAVLGDGEHAGHRERRGGLAEQRVRGGVGHALAELEGLVGD